ncbi:MAG TPA: hypothetical protein VLC29_03060, partial [Rhizomicrobium sp.]|nr:hypothetical protein [Rhizomicrobium sp.]
MALDRLALIPNEKRRLVVLDFSPRENTHFTRCCGCVLADAFELRVMGEGWFPLSRNSASVFSSRKMNHAEAQSRREEKKILT